MEQVTKAKQGKYSYFKQMIEDGELIELDSIIMAYRKNHKALLQLMKKGEFKPFDTYTNWNKRVKLNKIYNLCSERTNKDKETNRILFDLLREGGFVIYVLKKFKEEQFDYKDFLGGYNVE